MQRHLGFISVVVAVAMVAIAPLCCCGLQVWSSCTAGAVASSSAGDLPPCCRGESASDDSVPGPPGDEDGDCRCGKRETRTTLVPKVGVDVGVPPVLAVIDFPHPVQECMPVTVATRPTYTAAAGAECSLLRLHCALII
ncbi:MAG: hypothetical protein H7Y88_00550 [Phycisphaerales bacterium]|nr:hypothetical protein [Phycisphaerales bacterium]